MLSNLSPLSNLILYSIMIDAYMMLILNHQTNYIAVCIEMCFKVTKIIHLTQIQRLINHII